MKKYIKITRKDIIESGLMNDKKAVLISIISNFEEELTQNIKSEFYDVLTIRADDLIRVPTEKDGFSLNEAASFKLFTETDYIIIKEFVEKYIDRQFIVHCAAGVSRSTAVAIGICSILDDLDLLKETIKKHPEMIPNNLILSIFILKKIDRRFDFIVIYEEILKERGGKSILNRIF
nr:hypothetical protein [uncultured Cetobacterium sp.]